MINLKLVFIFLIILTFSSQSNAFDFCNNKNIETHTVLQNGRLKPLKVHATETLKYLTGKSKFNGLMQLQLIVGLAFQISTHQKKLLSSLLLNM